MDWNSSFENGWEGWRRPFLDVAWDSPQECVILSLKRWRMGLTLWSQGGDVENYMRNQRKKTGKDDFKPPFNAVAWVFSRWHQHLCWFGLATSSWNATWHCNTATLQHYTKYVKYAEDLETWRFWWIFEAIHSSCNAHVPQLRWVCSGASPWREHCPFFMGVQVWVLERKWQKFVGQEYREISDFSIKTVSWFS